MSTHNICFRGKIRKIFTWYSYLDLCSIDIFSYFFTTIYIMGIKAGPVEPGYALPLQKDQIKIHLKKSADLDP